MLLQDPRNILEKMLTNVTQQTPNKRHKNTCSKPLIQEYQRVVDNHSHTKKPSNTTTRFYSS